MPGPWGNFKDINRRYAERGCIILNLSKIFAKEKDEQQHCPSWQQQHRPGLWLPLSPDQRFLCLWLLWDLSTVYVVAQQPTCSKWWLSLCVCLKAGQADGERGRADGRLWECNKRNNGSFQWPFFLQDGHWGGAPGNWLLREVILFLMIFIHWPDDSSLTSHFYQLSSWIKTVFQ